MKPNALQIAAAVAMPDTPEHRRFRKLQAQIEAARQRLADWQRAMPEFAAAFAERVAPVRRRIVQGRREWAFELEQKLLGARWSKAEQRTLERLIVELALAGLREAGDDDELRAVARQWKEGKPIAGSLRRDEDGERLQVCGLQLSHVREIGEECLQARLQFLQPALG